VARRRRNLALRDPEAGSNSRRASRHVHGKRKRSSHAAGPLPWLRDGHGGIDSGGADALSVRDRAPSRRLTPARTVTGRSPLCGVRQFRRERTRRRERRRAALKRIHEILVDGKPCPGAFGRRDDGELHVP
jgi:hypothetical protein